MSFLNCFKNCVFFTFSFPLYNIRSADSHVSILNTSWKKYFIAIAAMVIMTRVSSYAGTSAWNVESGDQTTLSGPITATTLTKTGVGVGIIVPHASTPNITTVDIQAGTLQVNGLLAFGPTNTASIIIKNNAALAAGDAITIPNAIQIGAASSSSTATITCVGLNSATNTAATGSPFALTLSGNITQGASSTGTLDLVGGGVITLSGNNTGANQLTGGINVGAAGAIGNTQTVSNMSPTSGTNLRIGSTTAIPTTLASGINLAAGTILSTAASISPTVSSGVGIVLSGAASILPAASQTLTLNGAITGNYALTIGAPGTAGTVVKFGGTNTNNAAISVAGGTLELAHSGSLNGTPTINLAASTILKSSVAASFASPITFTDVAATINATAATTFSGVLTGGTGALTINGSAIVTLSGTQSGAFSITVGETAGLKISAATNVGTGAITLGAGTSFQATGNTTITNAITFG